MTEYSSHDRRKNTHDAIVESEDASFIKNKIQLEVNKSKVIFKHPKTLQTEEVDVSRLIRVFVNNQESHKRSVK